MLMLMSAVERTDVCCWDKALPSRGSDAKPRGAAGEGCGGKCVSTAGIGISIHHTASSVNNQPIMEAATAADFWLV